MLAVPGFLYFWVVACIGIGCYLCFLGCGCKRDHHQYISGSAMEPQHKSIHQPNNNSSHSSSQSSYNEIQQEQQEQGNQKSETNKHENIDIQYIDGKQDKTGSLSKKQLKKQQKKQKFQQILKQKRKQQRDKQKQKKRQLRQQLQLNLEKSVKLGEVPSMKMGEGEGALSINMNEGEGASIILNTNGEVEKQNKNQRKRKQEYIQKMQDSQKVVIDLQFYDQMTEKQQSSLGKQLAYCHSINRKMEKCFNYILTSATPPRMAPLNKKYNIQNFGIHILQTDLLTAFPKQKIVYLTGDADQDLEQFNAEDIYVIGGIVDHNRLKRITIDYADQVGIRARRLPMEGLKLKACVHLAVNHVWEWMLRFYNGSTWSQALKSVIPQRKLQQHPQTPNIDLNHPE